MFGINPLQMIMGGGNERPLPKLPEVPEQIAALQEVAARFKAGNPFKVGDLVVPREGAAIKWRDRPWLVVEVEQDAQPNFRAADHGDPRYGCRDEIRLAVFCDRGAVALYWHDSLDFEPFDAETAKKVAEQEAKEREEAQAAREAALAELMSDDDEEGEGEDGDVADIARDPEAALN